MDVSITWVTINSVDQVSRFRKESGKQYLGDIYINGSVRGDVTIECKDICECGSSYRYITEELATPNLDIIIPIENPPFSDVISPGGIGAIVSAFGIADKATNVVGVIAKYHEIVNHKYTRAAATVICNLFPSRNDGLPYTIDIAP